MTQSSRTGSSHIAILGSVNLDFVIQCHRLPAPGETIANSKFSALPGGKGANVALAAHRLGTGNKTVSLWACVGNDSHADTALTILKADGVDVGGVTRLDSESTGIAFVTVSEDGENQIVVASGANMAIPNGFGSNLSADALITQFEIPTPIIQAAITDFAGFVALNASPIGPDLAPLLPHTDLVIVNEVEYAAYQDALTGFSGTGFSGYIAVTLGSKGAMLYKNGLEITRAAPPKVDVIDTTGAGDCFAAALTVALIEGQSPEAALRFACTAGALTTTRIGTQTAAPTRKAVDALLA